MRFSAAWIALSLLCACGPGLNDLTIDTAPVAQIRAKVDVEGIRAAGYHGELLVGLLWASAAERPPACRLYADVPEIAAHCRQTSAVKIQIPPPMAPLEVDADGVVELKLDTLPEATVSSGNVVGRVSYGSIIVAADNDANGLFEPWGSTEGGGTNMGWQEPDRVVAASFSSLSEPQERLVLREGKWNPLSLFFPTFGCAKPPVGFSRLVQTLDLSGPMPSGTCEVTGIDKLFEVPLLSETAANEMRCSSWMNISDPSEVQWEEELTGTCLSEALYFESVDDPCMSPNIVPLSGCWAGYGPCEKPDWDYTDNPPEGWPCK